MNRALSRRGILSLSALLPALALLIALQNFSGTPVVSAVVGNGLLLIGMGLAHVGLWRFARRNQPAA